MTFFDPDSFRAAAGGKWVQRPVSGAVLIGVGLDSREALHGKAFIAIKGETHNAHDHVMQAVENGATLLVVEQLPSSISIPAKVGVIQVGDTRKALGKLAQAHRRTLKGTKVIAVTGSSGKTTTKRLIHSVLSTALQGSASPKSFNNDIGVPITLLAAKNSDKYVIAEVGTNAPGEIAHLSAIAQPDLAVITMLGRAHLERLGTVEGIAKEKMSMLTHLTSDGLAIVNADAPLLRPHLKLAKSRVLFGESADADLRLTGHGQNDAGDGWWFEMNGRQRFTLTLPGRHNAMNALAAVAVGRRLNLTDEQIAAGLAKAEAAPMRMTRQSIGPIMVFNDAYNANPDSMIASLDTFAQTAAQAARRIVILGDMLELGEHGPELHREIGRHLVAVDRRSRIDRAVFIGPLSSIAAVDVEKTWSKDRVTAWPGMTEVVGQAVKELLRSGDAVLIKASRGMGLERLVAAIESKFGESSDSAGAGMKATALPAGRR